MERPQLRLHWITAEMGDTFVGYKLDRFARAIRKPLTQLQSFEYPGQFVMTIVDALPASDVISSEVDA